MPLSKEAQKEYKRKRRLQGRLCEFCGQNPATVHHQADPGVRTIVLCDACLALVPSGITAY